MSKKDKCHTKFCRRKKNLGNFCYTCVSRKYRANHPIKYAYQTLRENAKRRSKVFKISFEYFKQLCLDSGYLDGKGRGGDRLSIDRIDANLGYEEGNLMVITVSENSRKAYLDYLSKQPVEEGGIYIGNPDDVDF